MSKWRNKMQRVVLLTFWTKITTLGKAKERIAIPAVKTAMISQVVAEVTYSIA